MSYHFANRTQAMAVDLSGLNVMLGMPAGRDLPALTVKSMMGTQAVCRNVGVQFQMGLVIGSSVVQWARDEVVDVFLKSDANRLFWVDSDMVWDPEDFMRMLALSKMVDVLCGPYTAKIETPTFYIKHEGLSYGEYGLIEIHGAGLGFSVMTREVVEKVHANATRLDDEVGNRKISSVFRIGSVDGKRQGEDMAFFEDIRSLGYKVWMDPDVNLGHIGSKTYRGSINGAIHPMSQASDAEAARSAISADRSEKGN